MRLTAWHWSPSHLSHQILKMQWRCQTKQKFDGIRINCQRLISFETDWACCRDVHSQAYCSYLAYEGELKSSCCPVTCSILIKLLKCLMFPDLCNKLSNTVSSSASLIDICTAHGGSVKLGDRDGVSGDPSWQTLTNEIEKKVSQPLTSLGE